MASSHTDDPDQIPDRVIQPLLRFMEGRNAQRMTLSLEAADLAAAPSDITSHVSVAVLEVEHNCIEDDESPDAPGLTGIFIVADRES